ncbi:MAG: serine/threonine protein kinase [Rhodospirillaceae bacterium]|nr:serine/threonine protein kinase [Rhodospirillaceae bacterium]
MAPSDLSAFLAGEDVSPEDDAVASAPFPGAPRDDDGPDAATSGVGGDGVRFNGRYEIRSERPLSHLSSVTATAFPALDSRDASAELVAYVCQTGLPPRWDILGGLRGLDSPVSVRVVDYGVADWPPDRVRRPIIVMTRPRGEPLVRAIRQQRKPMPEDRVQRQVLQPLLQAISELKLRRTFHGSINPTNIFLREAEGATAKAVLGECVTGPPGYGQPLLFEPIERGLAMPVGRGVGSMADDVYAIGVTLLFLVAGQLAIAQQDDRAILDAKIDRGSFTALSADVRMSPGMAELLRGMLADEPDSRWTATDIEMWVDGRRQAGRQPLQPRRAARSYNMDGHECWTARSLAAQMARKPDKAISALESGEIAHWLRRSLDDPALVDRLEEADRGARSGRGGTYEDRRLARSLMALDPIAPIRFKGKAIMPTGLGSALAEAYIRGSGTQEIAEMITAQLPLCWVNSQPAFLPEFAPLTSQLDTARGHLERPVLGSGLERVLYELNPAIHCMGPSVEIFCCRDLNSLVQALDDVAGRPGRPPQPFDRHVAAFILSRHNRIKEKVFTALTGDPKSSERGLAFLSLLSELQRETRLRKLANLAGWAVTQVGPVLEQFHSRSLREKVRDHIEKESKQGDLRRLLQVLTNVSLLKKDAAAFRLAQRDYLAVTQQIALRERGLSQDGRLAADFGRQVAALIGGLLAAVMVVVVVLMQA